MILFGIIGILVLGAVVILITQSSKPNTARAWVIAISSTVVAWIASFVVRLYLPSEVNLQSWFPESAFEFRLWLMLDYTNWPYMVAVIAMCVAMILTHTTRANQEFSPHTWSWAIVVTSLNLVSILAANPITMAISWMLIDLVELFSLLSLSNASKLGSKVVTTFGFRLLSTITLVFATAIASRFGPVESFAALTYESGLFFLIAAGLRLGVLPLSLPFLDNPNLHQGASVLFRLTPAASALVLIAHLPEEILLFNQNLGSVIQILTLLSALYSALMWITRKDSFEARPYWVIALSAFAVQSALNGHPEASRVWGLGMLLSGSLLFLFDPPIRRIRFLPLLGLLGFIGLPYTLTASGWEGLIADKLDFSSVLFLLVHSLLVLGYIRYITEADSTVTGLEKYARVTFPLGLVALIQTILILGLIAWPGILTLGNLWVSLISLGIVVVGLFAARKVGPGLLDGGLAEKIPFYRLIAVILEFFKKIFSFSWINTLTRKAFTSLNNLGSFLNEVLEGDGGILWSLVFLVIISIFFLTWARI
jgi:hypothetical protein